MFLWWGVRISIHALLAESDGGCSPGRATAGISIHALLAESDKLEKYGIKMQGLFLSTLSLRRATIPDREPAAGYLISIHALLAESDPTRWAPTCRISNFYPRSPCGERLVALLATGRAGYFYPRSPCGERLNEDRYGQQFWRFLSTLSLRRATSRLDAEH